MKGKSILAFILPVFIIIGISLESCSSTGYKNDAANIKNNGGNTRGDIYEGITGEEPYAPGTNEEASHNNKNYVNNNSDAAKHRIRAGIDAIKYSANNFKKDIANAGYNLAESPNTNKDYFKGSESDYLLDGDLVRLYEYNSPTELEGDISRILPNGTINGTSANYTRIPYYYRKGNTLIVYEGNEPAYIDEFRSMYGNTINP